MENLKPFITPCIFLLLNIVLVTLGFYFGTGKDKIYWLVWYIILTIFGTIGTLVISYAENYIGAIGLGISMFVMLGLINLFNIYSV